MRSIVFFMLSTIIFAQNVQYDILLHAQYSSLPYPVRIENSGIYGIAAFEPYKDGMLFTMYDSYDVLYIDKNKMEKRDDFVKDASGQILGRGLAPLTVNDGTMSKRGYVFLNNRLSGSGGKYVNKNNDGFSIALTGSTSFSWRLQKDGEGKQFTAGYTRKLAAVDITGVDAAGNCFVLVEYYITEMPLQVGRLLMVYSPAGNLLAQLEIPSIKGMSIENEFSVDAAGNFYHLLTEKDSFSLIRWSGLTAGGDDICHYPPQYQYRLHYNMYVPTREAEESVPTGIEAAARRNTALRLGETYVLCQYNCSAVNLSAQAVRDPGNDTVKTPPRLVVGANAKVPYKWGGFNTISQFLSGLTSGRYAGDIHTSGVSGYAVGVDCSGFLSRCWQLSSHYATSSMPSITTQYSTWDSLKPGDAIHRVGHVRMFVEKSPNGSLKVVESSGRDWGVSYWSYLPSDLTTYTPRYYNNMEKEYSIQKPVLTTAIATSATQALLTWRCDTTGVEGYRVYRSTDGVNWTQILGESSVKNLSVTVTQNAVAANYRVSSVLRAALTESNWSNVLAVKNNLQMQKMLLVDGFDREIGDWRGAGHTFVMRYAKVLESAGYSFESIKHSQLPTVNLSDYKAVIWIAGDQSTLDSTITGSEQTLLKAYLEAGGAFFVSGSEIGWDLYNKGNAGDKDFFSNYLKAQFVADDAGVEKFSGDANSFLNGISGNFAQTYEVSFPDEIGVNGGSTVLLRYSNNKVAGITFAGRFGSSSVEGKTVFVSFPLESIASDSTFNSIVHAVVKFLTGTLGVDNNGTDKPGSAQIEQNFPNPFNPSTIIQYSLRNEAPVRITVYDVLGNMVAVLVDGVQKAGDYRVVFPPAQAKNLASGVYLYRFQTGNRTEIKKMILIR